MCYFQISYFATVFVGVLTRLVNLNSIYGNFYMVTVCTSVIMCVPCLWDLCGSWKSPMQITVVVVPTTAISRFHGDPTGMTYTYLQWSELIKKLPYLATSFNYWPASANLYPPSPTYCASYKLLKTGSTRDTRVKEWEQTLLITFRKVLFVLRSVATNLRQAWKAKKMSSRIARQEYIFF